MTRNTYSRRGSTAPISRGTSTDDPLTWNDAIRLWVGGGTTLFPVAVVGSLGLAAL